MPSGPTLASMPWRDLKTLALFHALRFEGRDASADITDGNAREIAKNAGFDKGSSGKELKSRYTLYTMGPNRLNERIGDGKPYTVKRRYTRVLEMLKDQSGAIEVAQADLQRLQDKEQG